MNAWLLVGSHWLALGLGFGLGIAWMTWRPSRIDDDGKQRNDANA